VKNEVLSRRERKKSELREKIYRTAVKLFRSKGFEATNIEEITEAVDVSRNTFFNYYAGKDRVLHEIAQRTVAYYEQMLHEELESSGPVTDKIKRLLVQMGRNIQREKSFYRTIFIEIMRSQVGLVEEANDHTTVDELLGALLSQGQETGEIDAGFDPYQLSEMLTGIYFLTIIHWLNSKRSYSLSDRLNTAAEIFLNGCMVNG
jgi:AcrR family transcriptional regulator